MGQAPFSSSKKDKNKRATHCPLFILASEERRAKYSLYAVRALPAGRQGRRNTG
ncbi:MAG: hypothetical protein AAB471_00100 [Patescibacteria group bacterium]